LLVVSAMSECSLALPGKAILPPFMLSW
jgi:hypothetical protein